MENIETFRYEPKCVVPGCGKLTVYKIGAPWASGKFSELKNYGTCCEEHKAALLERARAVVKRIHPAEGETLGEVAAYRLVPGARDADLEPVSG